MRVLLLVSILLVCTVSAKNWFELDAGLAGHSQKAVRDADYCPVVNCANKGNTCNITNTICVGGDNLFCNYTRNACDEIPALKKYGEPCKDSDECEDRCINDVCNSGYAPGTPCSSNFQCAYSVFTGPYITICENKRCAGVQEGGECYSSGDCLPPLSCNTDMRKCVKPGGEGTACSDHEDCIQTAYCDARDDKCKMFKKKGDACDVDEEECGDGSCVPNDSTPTAAGTCKEYFSQSLNDPCSDASQCMEKLYCNSTLRKCQNEFTFKDSSKKTCNEDSDCSYFEECECDGKGENRCFASMDYLGVPSEYKKKWEKLNSCTAKCLRTDTACLAKCEGAQCSLYGYILDLTTDQFEAQGYPKCYADHTKKTSMQHVGMQGFYTCDGNMILASLLVAVACLSLLLM